MWTHSHPSPFVLMCIAMAIISAPSKLLPTNPNTAMFAGRYRGQCGWTGGEEEMTDGIKIKEKRKYKKGLTSGNERVKIWGMLKNRAREQGMDLPAEECISRWYHVTGLAGLDEEVVLASHKDISPSGWMNLVIQAINSTHDPTERCATLCSPDCRGWVRLSLT